jgi:hypothetical protein
MPFSVDTTSGLLATLACAKRAHVEYFLRGTEPRRSCQGNGSPGNAAAWVNRQPDSLPPWLR